jgi:plastocyanin
VTALVLAAALATGCSSGSGSGSSSGDSSGTGSDSAGSTIQVTFADGDVTPKGERVEVDAGAPITFEVTADVPGAIHVHSSPEQEFDYESGTHDYKITIDTPGVVEVESHDLEVVIVQLEVR